VRRGEIGRGCLTAEGRAGGTTVLLAPLRSL